MNITKKEMINKWQSIESANPEPGKYYILLVEDPKTGKFYTTFSKCVNRKMWNSQTGEYNKNDTYLAFTNPYSNCRHILVDLEYGDKKNTASLPNIFPIKKISRAESCIDVRAFIKMPDLDYPVDIKHECKCPCSK